ncbi:endo-1,4-beta-xylanase [Mucilaginibacter endophyticus]|uniref:endo-1,4-beta-xylanase n=1 Tax=Mucilaginibacter endophyticus TaxID=2675003 RepID=UPI000E0D26AD|nr:endo-1,4-beta-xylanase [Mucilaginibacter endophyticus]
MKTKIYITAMLLYLTNIAITPAQTLSHKGLKDYYKNYFPVGVAVNLAALSDTAERNLICNQFNSITPENAMKMGPIHPEENRYYWRDADSIVAFAQTHHIRIRGHNLCWHNQVPNWIFYDGNKKLVTKEILLKRLKDHINTVVGRYKGKIYAWDVVNEAVSDDSTQLLRNSLWYKICGEDFIFKAFEYAHEADPNAILFYNDYNTERPGKRERVYRLLKKLIDARVPVNAVGLQAHWSLNEPTVLELTRAIEEYASLGLKIQITELDISVYPNENGNRALKDAENTAFTPERAKKQAEQYTRVFEIFRKYRKYITGVTFWNLSDKYSWLDNFPVRDRKNYPLLFDQSLQPKQAFWDVVKF